MSENESDSGDEWPQQPGPQGSRRRGHTAAYLLAAVRPRPRPG